MIDYPPACTVIPEDPRERLSELADELYDLYYAKLSHTELLAQILGLSYQIKEALTGDTDR